MVVADLGHPPIVTVATGSTEKGALAASVEGVVTPVVTKAVLKSLPDAVDFASSVKDVVKAGVDLLKSPAPPPPPPAPPQQQQH